MWQRIQTLYLAIATILIAIMFFSNVADVIGTEGITEHIAFVDKLPYLFLLCSSLVAAIGALVSFKVRLLQMRVAVIGALIMIGMQIWIAVDYIQAPDSMVFKYTAIFPIICAILEILAARNAFLDQMIVESSSRLRSSRKERRARK